MMADTVDPFAPTPVEIMRVVGAEVLAGLFIGVSIRLLVFALQTAGTIAAQNLSISQMFGGAMGPEPEPVITNLLTLSGITAALAAGLHVKIAMALALSYEVVGFGLMLDPSDLGFWSASRGNAAFELAIGLALPFIVIAFIYNVSLGPHKQGHAADDGRVCRCACHCRDGYRSVDADDPDYPGCLA